MAEQQDSTFLDKMIGGGVGSALIAGLTKARQDEALRDQIRKKIIDEYYYNLPTYNSSVDRVVNARTLMDDTEDLVHRMPESFQDAWLRSLADANEAKFFRQENYPNYGGFYTPSEGSLNFPESRDLDASTILHEVGHKTDHDINLSKIEYENKERGKVPDVSETENFGKYMKSDVLNQIRPSRSDYGGIGYKGQDFLNLPEDKALETKKKILEESVVPYYGKNASSAWKYHLADMKALDPDLNIDFDYTKAHGRKYLNDHMFNALNNGVDGIAAQNSALSMEGSQYLKEKLAEDGNTEYIMETFPSTFAKMDSVYRNDPRIELEKRFGDLGALEEYRDTYYHGEDGEPIPYNKDRYKQYQDMYGQWKSDDGILRVRSPYGGYHYVPKFASYNPTKNAVDLRDKLDAPGYEYKDLDGDWNFEEDYRKRGISNGLKKKNFDNTFDYYVQTPYGRKGFTGILDAASYVKANPGLNKMFKNDFARDDIGIIQWTADENGRRVPIRKWVPYKNISEFADEYYGKELSDYDKKRLDEARRDFELMKKIRADKIKARNQFRIKR